MALSDKNIVITPNIGAAEDPKIVFSAANNDVGPLNITSYVYPTSNGMISFEGSAGQIFSMSNDMSSTIFSVNDISGLPSFDIAASGAIRVAPYGGTTTYGGPLILAAGTTLLAPLDFISGSLNTTAASGTFEYNGSNFYSTQDSTSGRGVIPSKQTFRRTSNGTAFGPAIGDFFGTTSSISLAASSVYEITAYCVFTKSTAGTATWTMTASSAPTRMVGTYSGSPITGIAAGAMTSGFAGSQGATTAAFAATGSLTTAVNHAFQFVIQVQTNAACNFRLRLTQSAGTATPLAGSYYTVEKISSTSGTYVA